MQNARADAGRIDLARVWTWALCVLLATLFAAAGLAKLTGSAEVTANFERWNYSEPFRLFVGACELMGAVGLLMPRLTLSACAGLGAILIGAVFTHWVHGEPSWLALATLGALITVAWRRRYDAFFTRSGPLPRLARTDPPGARRLPTRSTPH